MYNKDSSNLSYRGLQCPSCYQDNRNQRLHIFRTTRGLAIHLRHHDIAKEGRQQIVKIAKSMNAGESLIAECFRTGVLR